VANPSFIGDETAIGCSYEGLTRSVTVGQTIYVADGNLVLKVKEVLDDSILTLVLNDFSLGERKNMNFPGVKVDLPTLTEKDILDINGFGIKNQVEFLAASFVRTVNDVLNIREVLGE
jgi:pyruvate kinase